MFQYEMVEEPAPDVGLCSRCGEFYLLEECPVGMEELEVGGHIHAPICPECGSKINEYFYSDENAMNWLEWKERQ